jgi:hypothetical protein
MSRFHQCSKEVNSMMSIRRKLAIAAAGVVGLVGLGGGAAFAQSSPSPTVPPPAVSAPAPAPDTATEATTPETPGTETEAPDVAEPGDASLPGGGHADAVGQNVDHQFEGVE